MFSWKWWFIIFITAPTNKEMFLNFAILQSNPMFSRHLRWKWWLAEFRSMLLLILRLSTLKQAPIHILCSIDNTMIYVLCYILYMHIHKQIYKNLNRLNSHTVLPSIYIFTCIYWLLQKFSSFPSKFIFRYLMQRKERMTVLRIVRGRKNQ